MKQVSKVIVLGLVMAFLGGCAAKKCGNQAEPAADATHKLKKMKNEYGGK